MNKVISVSGYFRLLSLERVIMIAPFVILIVAITGLLRPNNMSQNNLVPLQTETNTSAKLPPSPAPYDVVFVSRKLMFNGSKNLDTVGSMPSVGPNSRFRNCAPGKLLIYKTDGTVQTLIDGSNPTVASLKLIDVNGPDVSYDGTKIVFAGLPAPPPGQTYDTTTKQVLGAWRIYKINVDGTGLTQLTFTDITINNAQFNNPGSTLNDFSLYDDIDPIWLPDGRICFSSTRYPGLSDYSSTRSTNLFVMNANGTAMHRITTERNAAERSVVDPLTGQIVFSRWWRNSRFPIDAMTTIANNTGTGFLQKDGLSYSHSYQNVTSGFVNFNGWTCSAINPDGTDLHLLIGSTSNFQNFQTYGCSFASNGDVLADYFPEAILFFESGFGGIRKHKRGAGPFTYIAGYTGDSTQLTFPPGTNDTLKQFYSNKGYASDVTVLPDDRLIYSWAANYKQDYGIYISNADGTNRVKIYNTANTSEMRAKAIVARPLPPIIADQVTAVASAYPPLENGPYNIDGTFTFNCLNVYANGPIDMDITSAPRIGDAGSIRYFIMHQRKREKSDSQRDWPILLQEQTIPASGAILNTTIPANQPLFEQLRTKSAKGYKVPQTGLPYPTQNSHVAGMNYAPPGSTGTCIGCHRGHTMIPLPQNLADAEFTNLAPGAKMQVSQGSTITANYLIDRKSQLTFGTGRYWNSKTNNVTNQWAKLKFPVDIKVKSVRIFNVPFGGIKNSTIQLTSVEVRLYSDSACTQLVATNTINQNISVNGTDVPFNNIIAKGVEVKFLGVTGKFAGAARVACAEIEVIASGSVTTPKLMSENVSTDISDVDVFPNPTANEVRIDISKLNSDVTAYAIYDLNGKIVSYINLSNMSSKVINVDLSTQLSGVYFIKLFAGDEQKIVRVVKL